MFVETNKYQGEPTEATYSWATEGEPTRAQRVAVRIAEVLRGPAEDIVRTIGPENIDAMAPQRRINAPIPGAGMKDGDLMPSGGVSRFGVEQILGGMRDLADSDRSNN